MFSFEHLSAVTILHFWSHNCLVLPWFFLAFPFLCWLVPIQDNFLVPLILLFSLFHVAFSLFNLFLHLPTNSVSTLSWFSAPFGFLFYVTQSNSTITSYLETESCSSQSAYCLLLDQVIYELKWDAFNLSCCSSEPVRWLSEWQWLEDRHEKGKNWKVTKLMFLNVHQIQWIQVWDFYVIEDCLNHIFCECRKGKDLGNSLSSIQEPKIH